uniref:BTB domain-containing protein n=1 Tax=Trichuris muris TaxID=70415 RepID=A0A5S6Q574_TRIMR
MTSGEELGLFEQSTEFVSDGLFDDKASETLLAMRRQGFLCDVTLLAHRQAVDRAESELLRDEEAIAIRAHRVILACSCPYFTAMFKSKMSESMRSTIFIHGVDADILKALVDFMYIGRITITTENVQDLLPAADLLQMTEVRDACCSFMERQMCVSNCLHLRAFAEVHSCIELRKLATVYIERHFLEVMETDDFCHINFEHLQELLSSDRLVVAHEDQVFQAIIKWINYDVAGRSEYLFNLLVNVRLPFVSPSCLFDDIVRHPLVRNCLSCSNHLIDALSSFFLKANLSCDIDSKPLLPRACYLGGALDARGLMIIGGQSPKAIREVHFFDFATLSWTTLKELPMRRCRFGVANLAGNIYAAGGFNGGLRVRTVELYKFDTNSWISAPPMHLRRSTLGVAEMDGRVYAVGGFDGSMGEANRLVTFRLVSALVGECLQA